MIADGDPATPIPHARKVKEKVKENGVETTVERTIEPDPKLIPKPKNLTGSVQGTTAELGDLHIAVIGAPAGATLAINAKHQLYLKLPKGAAAGEFQILVAGGGRESATDFTRAREVRSTAPMI